MSVGSARGPQAGAFERAISDGGVVLFPADTVYGLACDPADAGAITRLYALKHRSAEKAAAVMFFDLAVALDALPEIGERTRLLLQALLPGPLTVLLGNPVPRFALACGADTGTLGLRVVAVPALAGARVAVLQSSANRSGGSAPATVMEVDAEIRRAVDLVVDGGRLPGSASTVVDLRGYERGDSFSIVREGPVSAAVIAAAATAPLHFDPASYAHSVASTMHHYDELQQTLVDQVAERAPRDVLELGVGTGETTRRVLRALPGAIVVGIDSSPPMLTAASAALKQPERFSGRVALLQEPLPQGNFDACMSALTVHHLDAAEKQDLFRRIHVALRPGGRFVFGDVVSVEREGADAGPLDRAGLPADPRVALSRQFDRPSSVAEHLHWLGEAGFASCSVIWRQGDLVVICADA